MAQNPSGKKSQTREEQWMIQYGDIIVHQRAAGAEKWRRTKQDSPSRRHSGSEEIQALVGLRRGQAPEHPGDREQPDQNGQINMNHQGDVEKINQRQPFLNIRRSRQYQQDGENSGADQ